MNKSIKLESIVLFNYESAYRVRSTKASAAVSRLNSRDTEFQYSMGMTAGGFFYLLRVKPGSPPEKISGDLSMEEFVAFANSCGPQTPARKSKLDIAFEKQLGPRKQN